MRTRTDPSDTIEREVARLASEMRLAVQTSQPPAGQPLNILLLRVSDESRRAFLTNLDKDMDSQLHHGPVRGMKQTVVGNQVLFENSTAGHQARTAAGIKPLWAPDGRRQRLMGAWTASAGWLFVFILSTAANVDLPGDRNAATEAIVAACAAVAPDSPHDANRPVLHAHAPDRVARAAGFGWRIYRQLCSTYVLLDLGGQQFDALQNRSADQWTLMLFGSSSSRDSTVLRLLLANLNMARAGNWPRPEAELPRGFCGRVEPDSHGQLPFNDPHGENLTSRPMADPRQRWAVQLIAQAALDPSNTTFTEVARACGHGGLTNRGKRDLGRPLHQASDLTSAGRILLDIRKIRAYTTGKYPLTQNGRTDGQFHPGDGHILTPRHPGDPRGAVTYLVNVGRPEDDGWDWGVTTDGWRRILEKFWLPADFTPRGWAWPDHPDQWDWDQLAAAAARTRTRVPTGRHAANQELRPFTGLIKWDDDTHRYIFAATSSSADAVERYSLRRQEHGHAATDRRGNPRAMRSHTGDVLSSWPVEAFHHHWATLATRLLTQLLTDGADIAPATCTPATLRRTPDLERSAAALEKQACGEDADCDALLLAAARSLSKGDEELAAKYEAQAAKASTTAAQLRTRANALLTTAGASPPPTPPQADFGQPALALGALTGAHRTGSAPKALNTALRDLGAGKTRFEVIDACSIRMHVTVTVRCTDGSTASATGSTTLRRSVPKHANESAARAAAWEDLTKSWFRDGLDPDQLRYLSCCTSQRALRLIDRTMARRHPTLHPKMRAAITRHPVPHARAAIWDVLNPEDPSTADIDPACRALIERTYLDTTARWTRAVAVLADNSESRHDILSVLSALPDATKPLTIEALAELAGCPRRRVPDVARDLERRHLVIPAALQRHGDWTANGALGAKQRALSLTPCPWVDCPHPVADVLMLTPELVTGLGTSLLCRACRRPPTADITFPDSYLAMATPHRPGSWVRCSTPACTLDLGAGPGILWRWAINTTPLPTHRACTLL